MSEYKLNNTKDLQMILGKLALQSTSDLLADLGLEEQTIPFSFGEGMDFEITIKHLR